MVKRKEFNLEEIKDLYLNKGYSIPEIAKQNGYSVATLHNFLRRNNVFKEKKQLSIEKGKKIKEKWLNRTEEEKQKIKEKSKETCLERYNCENPSQNEEIKEKKKKTCLNNYNCENPSQSEEIKEKKKWIWDNKTEEERQKMINKLRENWDNKSEEEKQKIKEKSKETCLERYNCENPMQNEEIKEKVKEIWSNKTEEEKQKMINKIKENWNNKTEEERQEIKEKSKETCLERYNCKNPSQSEEIKKKKRWIWDNKTEEEKQEIIGRWRENWNNKTEEEKQKIRDRIRESWSNKTEEEKLKMIEEGHKTRIRGGLEIDKNILKELVKNNLTARQISKELNFHISTIYKKVDEEDLPLKRNIATEHCEVADLIKTKLDCDKEIIFAPTAKEYRLKNGQLLDMYFPDLKIGIEYNGYATHNSDVNLMSPEAKPKESSYHFNKFLQCEKEGIRLISIWDIDWHNPFYRRKIENILTNVFRPDLLTKIYARKTKIKELDYTTYAKFLNDYHFKNAKVSKYRFGLYYNDELVEVMGFSNHKVYQYELDRGCVHPKYIVVGGSQKLFKYFIDKYNPDTILTFSDNDLFTGNTYSRMGFEFAGYTRGSLFWINTETKEKLYRNPFKHREYVKLEKKGILLRCFNSGNKKFIWKKNAEKE